MKAIPDNQERSPEGQEKKPTADENACVHNTQNLATCAGKHCCFNDSMIVQAPRQLARNDGAYGLLIGSSG